MEYLFTLRDKNLLCSLHFKCNFGLKFSIRVDLGNAAHVNSRHYYYSGKIIVGWTIEFYSSYH